MTSRSEPGARAEAGPPDGSRIEINYAVETRDFFQGYYLSGVNFPLDIRPFPCVIFDELDRLTSLLLL
jgi:hypothetical protein